MNILVFPGWYPCRTDVLSGDFIQRHMQSIAMHEKVTVVFPVKSTGITRQERVVAKQGNRVEYFYYYPSLKIKLLDNFYSFVRYNYLCVMAARRLYKKEKIDIVHLYVLQKNYLLGFILKWLYNIPFVVSEQSTAYVDGGFEKKNILLRKMYSFTFNHAASWHAVSHFLLQNIQQKLQVKNTGVVIANVVDTGTFFYKPALTSVSSFVHVSNMVYQKNIEGMLHAFARVKKINDQFFLNLVGPLPAAIEDLISMLGLQQNVIKWNQRNYKEVAAIMQQSDCFVFFTRYETFGCVIIEANACGLPVIVTRLPVTTELINNQNGIFVENENIDDLAAKILSVIDNPNQFDREEISTKTLQTFNYNTIGKKIIGWYQPHLNSNL